MQDDLQKFSKELNGVFLRTIDDYSEGSSYTFTNISWVLIELEGGSLNIEKLISHVLKVIASVHPVQNPGVMSRIVTFFSWSSLQCDINFISTM